MYVRSHLSARAYMEQRDYTLAVLARRCPWLQEVEREEMLQEAYVTMLEKERRGVLDAGKMHPAQVRTYLTQTALHKALDEGKRAWRRHSRPLEHERDVIDQHAHPGAVLEAYAERDHVHRIVAGLTERQQLIVKLRYYFDCTPEQITRHLGVTSRTYRRELERAKRRIRDRYRWMELEPAAC